MKQLKAIILRTAGTNCDYETMHALHMCGVQSELVHVNQLISGKNRVHPYDLMVIPGGFSYGDDIAAGKVLANELKYRLRDPLARFVETGKPVVGICNGFQVLVKAGLLPGFDLVDEEQSVTLALNDSSRFQCEWTNLRVEKSKFHWAKAAPKLMALPIAHGEGKFITAKPSILQKLKKNKQVVLRYAPKNPNGSEDRIAGICNVTGNVIGMMPHPERFVNQFQHPNWPARKSAKTRDIGDGYYFWKSVVENAQRN